MYHFVDTPCIILCNHHPPPPPKTKCTNMFVLQALDGYIHTRVKYPETKIFTGAKAYGHVIYVIFMFSTHIVFFMF